MKSVLSEEIKKLEKKGQVLKIKEELDPNLEIAAVHLKVFEKNGPTIFFEKVKGSEYPCVSNLFGNLERSKILFEKTLDDVKKLVEVKNNPQKVLKNPFKFISLIPAALHALPKKTSFPKNAFKEIKISDLPQIKHWPMDGGAFITLPQVYSEDPDKPGIMDSNLGMYRIQLSGNEYITNKEIGLHYQLHRGIGIHQTKAHAKNTPLKVSIFVGGHPAHSFAAVMPLPEGLSEMMFAGVLAGKRFSYSHLDGYTVSNDADFVILGEVYPNENKPEGPFGDHFGYYSLTHNFPVMRVHKVLAKNDAVWPFTVVGRPPQEDTQFGALVHELTDSALAKEIPGLHEVNAVDAAGVHPLLLAVGSERYTPYQKIKQPQELLTIGNHILGKGQLSLAKYVWISSKSDNPSLKAKNIRAFFQHMLERVNWERDLHFYTNTTIDTLDYSGTGINTGSKVLIAAVGEPIRKLGTEWSEEFSFTENQFGSPTLVLPGIMALQGPDFEDYETENKKIEKLTQQLKMFKNTGFYESFPLIILCDDSAFLAAELNNFLWITFTRSNPANDMYGVESFTQNKHWGCHGPLIIDARKKPHHAPELVMDEEIGKRIDEMLLRYKL